MQSAPAGSAAELQNAATAIAKFVPDLIGTYVVALTVSNGVQMDTTTVIISTEAAPPIANAGSNQTVAAGSAVRLDGSRSLGINNQPLGYSWFFVATPPGSAAVLFGLRSATPTFVADKPGSYIVGLVVNDGVLSSSPSTVTITTGNTPPVAAATATPQMVNLNGLVQLDGSKSTDVDGNPLTYSWSLNTTQAPQSKAALNNPSVVNPAFTADVAGTYIAQLIVNDGMISSQPVTVRVTTNPVPAPTAIPGSNQTVVVGSLVQLQGSGSDPQNMPLSYMWTLTTVPPGSTASLSAANIPNPTFVADLPGTYITQLIVYNGLLYSGPATVVVTSVSQPPVAVPTTITPTVVVGSTVSLNGSSSYATGNSSVTAYVWSLSAPAGSSAALARANTAYPSFVPDVPGTYVAQLIVKTPIASSLPATVSISAGLMGVGMTPNPLILANTPEPVTITVSPAAGASPVTVTLSDFDSGVIALSSNTVSIPPDSSGANIIVKPLMPGNTSIKASAPGYEPSVIPVSVSVPTITVTFDNNAVAVPLGQSIGATITLSAPAPQPSGVVVSLVDIQDHDAGNVPGLVTFNPTTVVFPAGSTTGRFAMTGVLPGSVEILPAAAGYARVHVIPFMVTQGSGGK